MYRMPEKKKKKQAESRTYGFELLSKLFCQNANHPPFRLLSIKLKYPGFFTPFRFASFHFILFLWKLNSFMWIYEETLCLQPRRYVSISLHLHLYSTPISIKVASEKNSAWCMIHVSWPAVHYCSKSSKLCARNELKPRKQTLLTLVLSHFVVIVALCNTCHTL